MAFNLETSDQAGLAIVVPVVVELLLYITGTVSAPMQKQYHCQPRALYRALDTGGVLHKLKHMRGQLSAEAEDQQVIR